VGRLPARRCPPWLRAERRGPRHLLGTFRKDKSDAKAKAKTMLSATTQQWQASGMAQAEADGKQWAKAKRDEKAKAKAEAEVASRRVSRGKAKDKAKGKDGPAAKTLEAEAEVNPDWLLPMDKPKLAGPTQEANPRCELTAFITADGTRRRMHVMTSTLSSWGPSINTDFENLKDYITEIGCCKKELLEHRMSRY